MTDDQRLWLERCAAEGLTVPNWPTNYGGAGFSKAQYLQFHEEMRELDIRAPVSGMGTIMLGPTLLEYGTEEQKQRHLPRIARGEVWWCQGYSEPGSGSDLASLQTRAENQGDHYLINGQKIWTSGANFADWIFVWSERTLTLQNIKESVFTLQHGSTWRQGKTYSTHLRRITVLRNLFH